MSAWPEAVWVSKKLKKIIDEVFDIQQVVADNNALVDPINAQIAAVENAVTQANTTTQEARAEIESAAGDLSNLQDQINQINTTIEGIEEDLTGAAGIETAITELSEQIDKEMVVIATNTGSSSEPSPYDVGTNVGKHSIFLILTNS